MNSPTPPDANENATCRLFDADLEFLRSVDSPTIANAIERFDVRDRTEGFVGGAIRCMYPAAAPMVGHAVTVTMSSNRGPIASRKGYWEMWEAVGAAPSPSVIVVQDVSGAPSRCAYVGEVMATLATRLGCVGLVTDGGVRDLSEIEALGFQLFAAHAVVSHGNFAIVEVGGDVSLDGQTIRSGDILHGDRNGIVVIPPATLNELPAVVAHLREDETQLMAFYKASEFSLSAARSRAGY